ncbi:MAG: hypothetical protein WAM82_31660 [Thermoanaerobaculia bacterium]
MRRTLGFRLRRRVTVPLTVLLLSGIASSASAGNCSIHFGSTSCADRVDGQSLSIINSVSDCTSLGTETPNPIAAAPGATAGIAAGCTATGSTTTIPVTVCFNSDPQSFGASHDANGAPLQFTVMASCPGFKAKPVHLVIKSWHLDFSSMRPTGPSAPCGIDVDSTLVVANVGKAAFSGGFIDAAVLQKCANTEPWGCGNQGWGGQVPVYQLAAETTVTYNPSTSQKAPFHVDCSPPSPNKTVHGGSYVATWGACKDTITCDPGFAVATEDLLSVCAAGKSLLSACH